MSCGAAWAENVVSRASIFPIAPPYAWIAYCRTVTRLTILASISLFSGSRQSMAVYKFPSASVWRVSVAPGSSIWLYLRAVSTFFTSKSRGEPEKFTIRGWVVIAASVAGPGSYGSLTLKSWKKLISSRWWGCRAIWLANWWTRSFLTISRISSSSFSFLRAPAYRKSSRLRLARQHKQYFLSNFSRNHKRP